VYGESLVFARFYKEVFGISPLETVELQMEIHDFARFYKGLPSNVSLGDI